MHWQIVASILVCAALTTSAAARERLPVIVEVPTAGEGVGCYWERGRQFCSRYCYVEIDGRRYCQERARNAHSQAPLIDLPAFGMPPMK
jgi:hypothetical protein